MCVNLHAWLLCLAAHTLRIYVTPEIAKYIFKSSKISSKISASSHATIRTYV